MIRCAKDTGLSNLPFAEGSLSEIADWGPAEDWADWEKTPGDDRPVLVLTRDPVIRSPPHPAALAVAMITIVLHTVLLVWLAARILS